MAPSDDEENDRLKAQDVANPFVLFRRFADDQMSTLMNGVFSISSLFGSPSTPPRRSIQDYEKWLQEARVPSHRLAREAEEAGRIMDVYTKAHKEDQDFVQEPAYGSHVESLRCPYRLAEKEVPRPESSDPDICLMDDATRSCYLLAALGLGLPNTVPNSPLLGEQLSSAPVAYLLYSPYSPVRLEQQPRLCDHGPKWREAFEDLLAVQNGQGLPAKGSQRTSESDFDWARGMIRLAMCKRDENIEESSSIVGKTSETTKWHPGLLSCSISLLQSENDDDEDQDVSNYPVDVGDGETTEWDVYDRILGSQQSNSNETAKAASRSLVRLQPELNTPNTDRTNLSILSTLTTTERTILQDGSVHTKVVLKKRFSDGREESTETVHHQNAVRQTKDAASKPERDVDSREIGKDKENKENKFSGWFWS